MEYINDLVQEKSKDVAQFVASTAGAQHRPLRLRRIRLDQQRHTYGTTASRTEKQLSDVEAGVEELRNEVVERRFEKEIFCHKLSQKFVAFYTISQS